MARNRTVVLVDGENIDAVLGGTLLGRKPEPAERPRWDRVLDFARGRWGGDPLGLFFLNASNGHLPGPFVSALQAGGWRVVPLAGSANQKVVDIGIQRTLDALLDADDDVLLASHDADFADHLAALTGSRRVGLLAFPELVAGAYASLDVEVFDLETEVGAFNVSLPRTRIIPLDEFDPSWFLR